jgi:hypothetical protein
MRSVMMTDDDFCRVVAALELLRDVDAGNELEDDARATEEVLARIKRPCGAQNNP